MLCYSIVEYSSIVCEHILYHIITESTTRARTRGRDWRKAPDDHDYDHYNQYY